MTIESEAGFERYWITFDNGFSATFTNLGAAIHSIKVPDREGNHDNVILGYLDPMAYIENPLYMGVTVGRTAGRIGNASVGSIELSKNKNHHHIHGGFNGLSHKLWDVVVTEGKNDYEIKMIIKSESGEEGYPGNLFCHVNYHIYSDYKIDITYEANCDVDSLVNLTNHAYYNLSGSSAESILNHRLTLESDTYCPCDAELIPTGAREHVDNSPFDFRLSTPIGQRIDVDHPQLKWGKGYDHPWLLNKPEQYNSAPIVLECESTGRRLLINTNQSAVVVYTMNEASGFTMNTGRKGIPRSAVCLECQSPPIGQNGSFSEYSWLKAGQTYSKCTQLKFETF